MLLDGEELSAGVWYFSVENSGESLEPLVYSITSEFLDTVACPLFNGQTCAGKGTCNEKLGRCSCEAGFTLDDCSAEGLFEIPPNTDATHTPAIPQDDWVFWTIGVGCEGTNLMLQFNNRQDTVQESAPLLVMRKGTLPLMVEGSSDYYDYFNGASAHGPTQGIRIAPCTRAPCVVSPYWKYGGGTNYATGSAEPGIYFVGVYNDQSLAVAPVQNYSLKFLLSGCAAGQCAEGFVGETCERICPGMIPDHAFSNTPFSSGRSCSGAGECALVGAEAVCQCDERHDGPKCEQSCPGINANNTHACSGHGTCSKANLSCKCAAGYTGDDCSLSCPGSAEGSVCAGHGACTLHANGAAFCKCEEGFGGDACESTCPHQCSEHGHCRLVHDAAGGSNQWLPQCECAAGFKGDACDLACPGITSEGQPCGGNGTCTLLDNTTSCACFEGAEGAACEGASYLVDGKEVDKSEAKAGRMEGLAVGLTIAVLALLGLAAGLVYKVRQKNRALARFRSPMLNDEGAPASDTDTGVISPNARVQSEDEQGVVVGGEQEMTPMEDHVDYL